MNRRRFSFGHKALPVCAVALLLLCAPLQLPAQERESRAADQAAVLEWLSGLWSDLTAWLAESGGGATTQGSCAIDPNGCPHGG